MSPELTEFERLMAQLDYSLFVVTAAAGEERAGCLVGFASQVSIHPPRFLVGLSVNNRTYRVASQGAGVLVVHFVPEQAEDLAVLFGGDTGDEIDKFARCEWRPGPDGVPVLDGLDDWFAGRVLDRLPFGDHCGFLLEPIEGETHRSGAPLTFRRAKWIEPGHEPQGAYAERTAYRVARLDEFEWITRPHEPSEPAWHVAALSDRLGFGPVRGNVWALRAGRPRVAEGAWFASGVAT